MKRPHNIIGSSNSQSLFPKKEISVPPAESAVLMLHCDSRAPVLILSRHLIGKGYRPILIDKIGINIGGQEYESHEAYDKDIKKFEGRAPKIFVLEANYGIPGKEQPNFNLINYVLNDIVPSFLVLYSATEDCLTNASREYDNRVIPILAGTTSVGAALQVISDRSPKPGSRRNTI